MLRPARTGRSHNVSRMPAAAILTLAIVPVAIAVVALAARLVTGRRQSAAHRQLVRRADGSGQQTPKAYTLSDIEAMRGNRARTPYAEQLQRLLDTEPDPALAAAWDSVIAGAGEWRRKHG